MVLAFQSEKQQFTASARSRQRLSRIGAGVAVGGLALVVLGILLRPARTRLA